ncbi:hypothetical protein NMY22_g18260 [Coprinellus aureogranulatus]|nr:hypothetical protein NMY22_g18260 [Coprinellus aureogranulatus]
MSDIDVDELFLALTYDLQCEVTVHFSIRELRVLTEVERWSDLAYAELNLRLGIVLHDFGIPSVKVKGMLGETESVISGSAALWISNLGKWLPTDIDFYCPRGARKKVMRFLASYGYEEVEDAKEAKATDGHLPVQVAGTMQGAHAVLQAVADESDESEEWDGSSDESEEWGSSSDEDMDEDTDSDDMDVNSDEDEASLIERYGKHVMKSVTLLRKGENGPFLNIIESLLPCAEAPIFCFHSTVVMNAVTAEGAICFYPDWTLKNKGVVNRASGLVAWEGREQNKEHKGLKKYRERKYVIHEDCTNLHEGGARTCDACGTRMREWRAGLSMTFNDGDTFEVASRTFCWRLGHKKNRGIFWRDRGALVLVQGDGDGRGIIYDGLRKRMEWVTSDDVVRWFPDIV